jgi:hypothetical protein
MRKIGIISTIVICAAPVAASSLCIVPCAGPDIVVTAPEYYSAVYIPPLPDWLQTWDDIPPDPYQDVSLYQNFVDAFKNAFNITTLKNPAVIIKLRPGNAVKIATNHIYSSTTENKSKFNEKYSDPLHIVSLIAWGVTQVVPEQTNTPNVLTYTVDASEIVGEYYRVPTNRFTIWVYDTRRYENGFRVYFVTNIYPGD